MVIRESIRIQAPLSRVWEIFSTLADWNAWNTVCRDCSLVEGYEMEAGTCFSFTLRPYILPIKITPRISRCEHGHEVEWVGKRLGIHARHRFTFLEENGAVLLSSVEEFSGPLLWLTGLIGIPGRLHRLTRKLLSDIRRQAEACDGEASRCG
jgi:ligand-binding SRPBCC domain-containing protein